MIDIKATRRLALESGGKHHASPGEVQHPGAPPAEFPEIPGLAMGRRHGRHFLPVVGEEQGVRRYRMESIYRCVRT